MTNVALMSLEQALELAHHASPSPEVAHQALLTLREHICQMESDTASAIVRSACETDPADADHPDTICISVADLQRIAEQHLRVERAGAFFHRDKDGASRIAKERHRHQSVEGYSIKSDTGYVNHELVDAAISYAMVAGANEVDRRRVRTGSSVRGMIRAWWPWAQFTFKPGRDDTAASRIRELEKAGALLAAEIDRLLAIPPQESQT